VQFVDVAAASGIQFVHVNGASADRHLYEIMSGGGLFCDYDRDGWLDAVLVDGGSLTSVATNSTARHRLYRNRGNGTQDVSAGVRRPVTQIPLRSRVIASARQSSPGGSGHGRE
jgi:hypothetical protein